MNWIKENKKLAAILGVTLLGALGLGAFLFLSYSAYATKLAELETVSNSVAGLKSQKLFPNSANAAEKEKRVTEYADKVNLLRGALLDAQQAVQPITETEFQAKLKDRVNAIKKAADSSGILLPADFALGFDEYAGTVPRSAEVAAELSLQLDVIEKLVISLIESGIKSLDSLERTKLPNEKAAPPPPVVPVATKKTPASTKKKPKNFISQAAAAEPVLDRYPIKVMFTTDQAPLQASMNVLSDPARMPHFLVIRQFRLENEKPDGPRKDSIRLEPSPVEDSAAPPPDKKAVDLNAITPPAPAPPDTITIMGEEMLKIYLEVDYVRFRKPVSDEAETAAPAAKP
jgi:hypothetical protein